MRGNIATVPAIPRSVLMIERITWGIVFISTLPERSLPASIPRTLLVSVDVLVALVLFAAAAAVALSLCMSDQLR